MVDDIRYCELALLQRFEKGQAELFNPMDEGVMRSVGLQGTLYIEMVATLLEELNLQFDSEEIQLLISRLRGELSPDYPLTQRFQVYEWADPRTTLMHVLISPSLQRLRITYRGLRRIQELRDLLRQDRVLEDFGVLLSIRYLRRDLQDALRRAPDVPISVIYADMDDFGKINKSHGQAAGDVVMKKYLECVHDSVGLLGTGYRGVGDETVTLIAGQSHEHAIEIAEKLRTRVAEMVCDYRGTRLPTVTASIGVATTPPASREMEIENLAEERKRKAKAEGKNRVISS